VWGIGGLGLLLALPAEAQIKPVRLKVNRVPKDSSSRTTDRGGRGRGYWVEVLVNGRIVAEEGAARDIRRPIEAVKKSRRD